jgi:hypothetical protein
VPGGLRLLGTLAMRRSARDLKSGDRNPKPAGRHPGPGEGAARWLSHISYSPLLRFDPENARPHGCFAWKAAGSGRDTA